MFDCFLTGLSLLDVLQTRELKRIGRVIAGPNVRRLWIFLGLAGGQTLPQQLGANRASKPIKLCENVAAGNASARLARLNSV